jgi:agmatine deiminase
MPSRETAKISDFRLPAEWEPQAAVWFAWPVRQDLWSGQIQQVRQQLAALYVLAARSRRARIAASHSQR